MVIIAGRRGAPPFRVSALLLPQLGGGRDLPELACPVRVEVHADGALVMSAAPAPAGHAARPVGSYQHAGSHRRGQGGILRPEEGPRRGAAGRKK